MHFSDIKFSIIVPVYNRPEELEELLISLKKQSSKNFEIVIVEDGSKHKSDELCKKFANELNISYYFKENTGPGKSRNFGMQKAKGNYFIFLDSDCVLPENYFKTIEDYFKNKYVDCFGGPDAADENFTDLQKAINFSMTSFFTTGGIRGGSEKLGKFNPRSFNMGLSQKVFEHTGGFPTIRYTEAKAAGEDLDLSLQIQKLGFSTALIKDAFVFHKRRTSLKQFFKQVFNFGYARVTIGKIHKGSFKIFNAIPSLFLISSLALVILAILIHWIFILPIIIHILLLFGSSLLQSKSIKVAFLSILTSYIQLYGYGLGVLKAVYQQIILGKSVSEIFR